MTLPEEPYILAIDQGTTSTRAILFDANAAPIASHAIELRQIYPANGWVEQPFHLGAGEIRIEQ